MSKRRVSHTSQETVFLSAGGKKTWPMTMTLHRPTTHNLLAKADDWECAADLPGWNEYPEITKKTGMRPHIVLHSQNAKEVPQIELSVS